MSPDLRPNGELPFAQTLPARPATRESVLARIRTATRASPWASLAARSFVLMLGLLVLAWIGRAATAATKREPSTSADAGTIPTAVLAQLAPGMPTPPLIASQAPVPAPAPAPSPSSAPPTHARATPEDPVYVNYAGTEELRRLPGVGPKRAEAIVALRQRMGKFQRVEDLLRVKGVGRATLRKWRPLLRLDAPAMADAGTPPPSEQDVRAP